jgi:DNA-binding ferritin-like protein
MADMVEERQAVVKSKREELGAASQDAVIKARAEVEKARIKGEEVSSEAARKHLDTLEDRYNDLQDQYNDVQGKADESGRERVLRSMAQNRVMQAELYGDQISLEEAMIAIRLEMGEIDPDEAEEELAALQGG